VQSSSIYFFKRAGKSLLTE